MSHLPVWPHAYPLTGVKAVLKSQNSDFYVDEIPSMQPCGDGEHVWLHIEKNGANTAWIAKRLAEIAGVKEMDVGYAGMKDRNAITRQWFSIYLPRVTPPNFADFNDAEMTVLTQTRHSKKLRRGDLLGNRFRLILRDVQGDKAALERNLNWVKQQGVPNYFGEQRFGHDGNNIESGRAMLAGEIRVRNPSKKSIYLSAMRSLIFNEVIAERINQGLWGQRIDGDVLDDIGLETAPLWGRGRSAAAGAALALEQSVVERWATVCDGLEHAGLSQERRAVAAKADQFSWQWQADTELSLTFSLPAGYYATSVIRELMEVEEPSREGAHEADVIE